MKIRKSIIVPNSFKIKVNKFEQLLILDNRERKYYISIDDTDSIYLVDTIDTSFKWCKDDYGTMIYLDNDGFAHRDNDLPAIEWKDGTCEWWVNGKKHRDNNLPAVEFSNGGKYWYVHGELHRDDGPAVEFSWNEKRWYQQGILHRMDGPAVIKNNGNVFWYQKGQKHRLDGPAIEAKSNYKEWWLYDTEYTEEEFNQYLAKKQLNEALNEDLDIKNSKPKVKI